MLDVGPRRALDPRDQSQRLDELDAMATAGRDRDRAPGRAQGLVGLAAAVEHLRVQAQRLGHERRVAEALGSGQQLGRARTQLDGGDRATQHGELGPSPELLNSPVAALRA